MADKSRLEALLEKQAKLEADISEEKGKEEANKVLSGIGANVATVVQQAAKTAKVDIKVLHGKFFALSVDDAGKLSVEVVAKAKANGGSRKPATASTSGNFEYFLADGRGGFADVQTAMGELGIPEANRPKHNRYDRLSADWQKKIIRKAKAEKPEATEPATEPEATEPEATEPEATEPEATEPEAEATEQTES